MTTDERIQRINQLAKKSKVEGLTKDEKEEQNILRQEYLAIFRQNLKQQLDSVKIVDAATIDN